MKKIYPILAIIFLCVLIVCVSYAISFPKINNYENENLEELLIQKDDLPGNWEKQYIMPITGDYDFGDQNIMVMYYPESHDGFAEQYIYKFQKEFSSIIGYYQIKNSLPLLKSDDNFISYSSKFSDKWYLRCFLSDEQIRVCEILARYKEYIVYLSIATKKEKISPKEFHAILDSIESRMKYHLDQLHPHALQ